jgi:hypothetical protein
MSLYGLHRRHRSDAARSTGVDDRLLLLIISLSPPDDFIKCSTTTDAYRFCIDNTDTDAWRSDWHD